MVHLKSFTGNWYQLLWGILMLFTLVPSSLSTHNQKTLTELLLAALLDEGEELDELWWVVSLRKRPTFQKRCYHKNQFLSFKFPNFIFDVVIFFILLVLKNLSCTLEELFCKIYYTFINLGGSKLFTFLEKEQYVVQDTEITNNHNTSTIVTTSEVPHSITQTESIIKQLKTLNLTPVSI